MSGGAADATPRPLVDTVEDARTHHAASPTDTLDLGARLRLALGDSGRDRRRQVAIMGYVGSNGAGKTLAMVHDTIPSLLAGRPVLSTIALIDPRTGEPFPNYTPLTDWAQLRDFRDGDLLLDEIVGIASSRSSSTLPQPIATILNQLRKRDIMARWTAPAWARADKIIREVTRGVTLCSGSRPTPAPRDEQGRRQRRMWQENRLFRWKTYDATTYEEFTLAKTDPNSRTRIKPAGTAWFWRPGSQSETAYRTLDDALRVGEVSDSGLCLDCHGRRVQHQCRCARPDTAHSPRTAAVTAASLTRSHK